MTDLNAAITQVEMFVAATATLLATNPSSPSLPARFEALELIRIEFEPAGDDS